MERVDVAVVGGGPVGMMFARMMAEQQYSVLVIEKKSQAQVGDEYDLFHLDEERFQRYTLAQPRPGDPDYANRFESGVYKSANNTHTCFSHYPNLLLKRAPFLARMQAWAAACGVRFCYETDFCGFLLNEAGQIRGVKCNGAQGESTVHARLTVDCSGKEAVLRRQAPGANIDTFALTPRDLFYIHLQYVQLRHPEKDALTAPIHYPQWKGWFGQGDSPAACLFGTGANLSYEYAATCCERFRAAIPFPEHDLLTEEKGTTPYHRPPYSMVADGFLCIGDAACMTKPFSGEGITSAWVGCEIAARVAGKAMAGGAYPTQAALWDYNTQYAKTQGADFAYIMAVLCNAVDSTPAENEYEFAHKIVFNDNNLTHCNRYYNYDTPLREVVPLLGKLVIGVVTGNISLDAMRAMLRGIVCATLLKSHYRRYPQQPAGYAKWAARAEKLWKAVGSMADVVEKAEAALAAKAGDTIETARWIKQAIK
ncbi:MAG: FAD-dependent monooxygenase [Oscillospiraceae bacterium]|jgi:flavin-dependent dehydrogenase|nr:FAD-dependent monooxygenase [Oscillospiraceae bacterium]